MQTAETPSREAPQTPVDPGKGSGWRPQGGTLFVQLAVLSAAAGAIHLSVATGHFSASWMHGAFFISAGLSQIVWAGLLFASPTRPVLILGALGNGLIAVTWGVSRWIGVPVGPQPWVPEPIGAPDLLTTVFEVLIVATVVFHLRKGESRPPRELSLARLATFGVVVLALTSGALVRDGLSLAGAAGTGSEGGGGGGGHHAASPIGATDPLLLELESAVEEGGAKAGMDLLEEKVANDENVARLSHQYIHAIARTHYELSPDPKTAFRTCDDRFEGACYHGVLQGYFGDNPGFTGQDVANICTELGAVDNIGLKWQCLHGLGHGLTMFFQHNLVRPLRYCDFLAVDWDRRACYGGVFMENVIWAQNSEGPRSSGEGVVDEDLQYPCNAIDDKYKTDCWLMQTSTILDLVEWDFARAFAACDSAGKAWVSLCYESMGRDIAGYAVHDPNTSGSYCLGGQKAFQGSCFAGAAKQLVDYHGGTDQAFQMCASAPENALQQCYQAMGEMIYFYWSDDIATRRAECAKAGNEEFIKLCEFAAQVRGPRVVPLD